jgi:nitroimidazol reductase NimA-like FMN-containing flavoprotein (pyridoxamine 5'-phosphate oxidase superfamily)
MELWMRRKEKALQDDHIEQILRAGEYGIMSTVDGSGQPYGVPLNYLYMSGSIYFHCALEGHKLKNIDACTKVSFCVVGRTNVVPEKFSTDFESVIVFGKACVVDGEERYSALLGLVKKYSPDFVSAGKAYIAKLDSRTKVVKIEIESVTGKANIEP